MKMTLTTLFLSSLFVCINANATESQKHPTKENLPSDKPVTRLLEDLEGLTLSEIEIEKTDTTLSEKEKKMWKQVLKHHGVKQFIGQIKPDDENVYITPEILKDVPLPILQKMSKGNQLELKKEGRESDERQQSAAYYQRLRKEYALFDAEIEKKLDKEK